MSTAVMSACWGLQMPPTPKAVLISLADNANDHGECWPSISTICQRTCLGKTAVIEAIKWLEAAGLLLADRSNGRHTRYLITPTADLMKTGPRSKPAREADRSATQTGAAYGPDRLAVNRSGRRTQPVREADTNRQEPSIEATKSKSRGAPLALPDWLPELVWRYWHDYRNRKPGWTAKARELSLRTLTTLHGEGHDPQAVIEQSIERGWTGLFPVRGDDRSARGSPPPQAVGKTAQGLMALDDFGGGHGLDQAGNFGGAEAADVLGPGAHAGSGGYRADRRRLA